MLILSFLNAFLSLFLLPQTLIYSWILSLWLLHHFLPLSIWRSAKCIHGVVSVKYSISLYLKVSSLCKVTFWGEASFWKQRSKPAENRSSSRDASHSWTRYCEHLKFQLTRSSWCDERTWTWKYMSEW